MGPVTTQGWRHTSTGGTEGKTWHAEILVQQCGVRSSRIAVPAMHLACYTCLQSGLSAADKQRRFQGRRVGDEHGETSGSLGRRPYLGGRSLCQASRATI